MTEPTVKKISNFLSPELLNECQEFSISNLYNKRSYFRSSYGWDEKLRRNTSPVLIYELGTYNKDLFNKIKKEVTNKTGKYVDDVLIQYWGYNCYLDWHTDGNYSDALTIYLNKEWRPEWGGYFLFGNPNEFNGILPVENLGVLQNSGIPHCVTPVLSNTEIRISLQTFISDNRKTL